MIHRIFKLYTEKQLIGGYPDKRLHPLTEVSGLMTISPPVVNHRIHLVGMNNNNPAFAKISDFLFDNILNYIFFCVVRLVSEINRRKLGLKIRNADYVCC